MKHAAIICIEKARQVSNLMSFKEKIPHLSSRRKFSKVFGDMIIESMYDFTGQKKNTISVVAIMKGTLQNMTNKQFKVFFCFGGTIY